MRIILSAICAVLYITSANGQFRKYGNDFLDLGIGARALSMSKANVASVNDVTSGYWNPAGLMNMESNLQVAGMHSEYFGGIAKYDYGAFAVRLDSASSLGFSVLRVGVDNVPYTIELIDGNGNIQYDKVTSFSVADYGFLLSYARKTKSPLNYGVNVKVIHRLAGDFAKAWGFGLDGGIQYQKNKWAFGLMARDITSTFNAWNFTISDRMKEVFTSTDNVIPENSLELIAPSFILGGSRKIIINKNYYLMPEINLISTVDKKRNVLFKSNFISMDPAIGLEIACFDFAFIRAGVGNFQKYNDVFGNNISSYQPNMGLGIKIKQFTIDYALTDIGDNSVALYSNVFSLRYNIYKQYR